MRLPSGLGHIAVGRVEFRPCRSFRDPEVLDQLRDFSPWLGISIAAPILKAELFSIPLLGTINLHKSLLPDYRGIPPAFWELHDGARVTGATVHWIDDGLDTGRIIHQQPLAIPCYATVDGLAAQLDVLGEQVLVEALRLIDRGEAQGRDQASPGVGACRRPPWLLQQAIKLRLNRRRRAVCSLRSIAKWSFLSAYVHLWAPVRNLVLRLTGRCRTTVLLYHRVSDDYLDSVTVGIEQFQQQIELLRRCYQVIDLNTFLADPAKARRKPTVVITFDDGYLDNYLAARLLRRAGLPCTFFVSTGMIGTGRAFEHDLRKLGGGVPAMTWEHVRQMVEWGFQFGNHTANHVDLGRLPPAEGLAEVQAAQSTLHAKLSESDSVVPVLAFPFGLPVNMSRQTRESLGSIGMTACLSACGGQNAPGFDPWDVRRQPINHSFSAVAFLAAIEGWGPRRRVQAQRPAPATGTAHPLLTAAPGV
ncbi:MAG: hypothetical protein AMXMBFR13_14110 [Phycisphaerae bacterium]